MAVKVGFIGTGGIASYHFNHLEKMDDVRVVAVCDAIEERARQAAERWGARVYPDHRTLLSEADLDALYICIPPFAHGEMEHLALERGLPLFVEKPVHLDLADARSIAQEIEAKGLVSAVGYQDRYQDIIDRLRAYLSGQQVGLMMGYWMGGMPGVYWWRRRELSGGQAVEQTTHIFDMARYLFGEVRTVFAGGTKGLMADVPDYNIEDASAVTLFFESGLVGTIFSACFLNVGGRGGMDIFCKNAYIAYQERTSVKITEPHCTIEMKNGNDFGFAEDRTFIDAVASGDGSAIRSTYPDAVKSLALSLAANKSLDTGEPVAIDRF